MFDKWLKKDKRYHPTLMDITEYTDNSKGNIVIIPKEVTKKIDELDKSLYMFSNNEWLIFANTLVGISENLYITIPIQIFSIPTKISTASIDYHHSDILIYATSALEELDKKKLAPILDLLQSYCDSIQLIPAGFDAHKHPSPSGFSGSYGDHSKDVRNPGICYRTQDTDGKEILITSAVFANYRNTVSFCDVEGKLVNVEKDEKTFCKGTYTFIPTILAEEKFFDEHDAFGRFLPKDVFDYFNFQLYEVPTYRYELIRSILRDWRQITDDIEIDWFVKTDHYKKLRWYFHGNPFGSGKPDYNEIYVIEEDDYYVNPMIDDKYEEKDRKRYDDWYWDYY